MNLLSFSASETKRTNTSASDEQTRTFPEVAAFLMKEVRKEHFVTVIHNKIVYFSHGGKCF